MRASRYFQMADKGWYFTIRTDTGDFSVNRIGHFDGQVAQRRGGCYVVKTKGNRHNPARFVVWQLVDETKSGLLIRDTLTSWWIFRYAPLSVLNRLIGKPQIGISTNNEGGAV